MGIFSFQGGLPRPRPLGVFDARNDPKTGPGAVGPWSGMGPKGGSSRSLFESGHKKTVLSSSSAARTITTSCVQELIWLSFSWTICLNTSSMLLGNRWVTPCDFACWPPLFWGGQISSKFHLARFRSPNGTGSNDCWSWHEFIYLNPPTLANFSPLGLFLDFLVVKGLKFQTLGGFRYIFWGRSKLGMSAAKTLRYIPII